MNKIAYMGIDIHFSRISDLDHRRGLLFLHEYDLPYTDLSVLDGIIITNHIDEYYLLEHETILLSYLEQGGVIFCLAEKSLPWLKQIPEWKRSPIPLKDRELNIESTDNGLFEGVRTADLEYRKGVRGFFSRGYFDNVPSGSKVLITDQSQKTIVYVDRESTNGTIYAGAGTDMYRIYTYEENTANRVGLQMLESIRKEARRIKGGRTHEYCADC